MEELINLIATDSAPSEISDQIKQLLYSKAAERVDSARPEVATLIFNGHEGDEE